MQDDAPIMDTGLLPWHVEIARTWLSSRERFAHAWLIHGATGIGKLQFARACASSMLCENPQGHLACGACDACLWLRHGNHPDFRALRPEAIAATEGPIVAAEDAAPRSKTLSRDIRIEQVRALETWLNTATHRGGNRIVLLYPAEALNAVSANALLKILEEPPAHTVFLIVADAPDRLLPTLVSRCRRLPLAPPAPDAALQWLHAAGVQDAAAYLAAAGGAPLAAARLAESGSEACPAWLRRWLQALAAGRAGAVVPELVTDLEKQPAEQWLDAFQRVLTDLACVQAGAPARYYPGLANLLTEAASRVSRVQVTQTARWLTSQQRVSRHPLNPGLFTHAVLLRVSGLAAA